VFSLVLYFSLFFPQRLNEIATVPDFQILDTLPSKRADEDAKFHHLLDTAMYDPRRKVEKLK